MNRKQKTYHKNPYKDYVPHKEKVIRTNGQFHLSFAQDLKMVSENLLEKFNSELNDLKGLDKEDISVYTGISGYAQLYLHIAEKLDKPEYLQKSLGILEKALPKLKKCYPSFLKGDAGPLALTAVVCRRLGMNKESAILVDRVKSLATLMKKHDIPNEILYGRAGFLYALLYLNHKLGDGTVESSLIADVVSIILKSGVDRARREGREAPLMFKWYDDYYLGAAHGLSGILYMLLQARQYMSENDKKYLVRPTLEYLRRQRLTSGHYPSVIGEEEKRSSLVQWCHGAPGFADTFALAFKVFGDESFKHDALRCGEITWREGILSKGYGICHGVSGNAYTFLTLYNLTKDVVHLHRACKFCQWCEAYGEHQTRTPDRPLSLFEGLAGAIYFLIDIQHPEQAKFPAYGL